jgi:hypothetical protein
MTSSLRRALVESGVVIPTTLEEVKLAESNCAREVSRDELDASFAKLEQALDGNAPEHSFMHLHQCVMPSTEDGLALAARNGKPLDAETLAKIEDDVSGVIRKPRKP